jgi:hypothetical protein
MNNGNLERKKENDNWIKWLRAEYFSLKRKKPKCPARRSRDERKKDPCNDTGQFLRCFIISNVSKILYNITNREKKTL